MWHACKKRHINYPTPCNKKRKMYLQQENPSKDCRIFSLAFIFTMNISGHYFDKLYLMLWLHLLICCSGSVVSYQEISNFLISSRGPQSHPHNTCTVFLLGSECKAITHWRVCLNHTEWLWILNVGLEPTEERAHGRHTVSWVLIWFFFSLQTAPTTHC